MTPPPSNHPLVRVQRVLFRVLEWTLILAMAALVLDVLWGVFSRHVLRAQGSWTEELARFLLVWVGLLGASLAFGVKGHLGVDYFVGKFDPAGRMILQVFAQLVVLFFAVAVLLIGGWNLVASTLRMGQVTPALGLPKGCIYLAVPISGVFTFLFSLGHIAAALRFDPAGEVEAPPTGEEAN